MRTWMIAVGLFLLSLASGSFAQAAGELKPVVASDQLTPLLEAFSKASPIGAKQSQIIMNKQWTCDIYGLRSRILSKSGLGLYELNLDGTGSYINKGSQVIRSYKFTRGTGLSGSNGQLREELRLATNGHLMGHLVVDSTDKIQPLALSDCQPN